MAWWVTKDTHIITIIMSFSMRSRENRRVVILINLSFIPIAIGDLEDCDPFPWMDIVF